MATTDRRSSAAVGGAAAGEGLAPKLAIDRFADGGLACLRFTGTIDEGFEGKRLGQSVAADVLVLDLGGVKKISSFGIREWVDFVGAAGSRARELILIDCAPKVVDQLNMVANFTGGGRVYSLYAPFRCDYCDSDHRALLQVDRDREAIRALKLPERPCPQCGEGMYFDEDGATYFSYVLGQEPFELPPAVAGFLAGRLDYAVPDASRKLRVDKTIEGRTTYLRLSGDLAGGFPRDKLAEGLEGTVIVDLGDLGRIEPAGAAEWRAFVQATAPLVEIMYLAQVPPAFLEKLCARDDLGPKAQVLSFSLPYRCEGCGSTSGQLIDLATHHAVTKFATAPELRCPRCKAAMQCVASEASMTALPGLGKPAPPPELMKSLGALRERAAAAAAVAAARASVAALPGALPPALAAALPPALASRMSGRLSLAPSELAGLAPPAPPPRQGLLVPVLAALIAVALAAGGYLAYQRLAGGGAEPEVTARSAPARPAWIAGDAPGAACAEAPGRGVACAGASAPAASREEAEADAADAAYEAAAVAIAQRIADAGWRRMVPPIYAAAREQRLGALAGAPGPARREAREARAAVAAALRATGGAGVPAAPTGRYWEEVTGPEGKRYVAFAQVALGGAELTRLAEAYARPAAALGATAVGLFPLVAWRHPRIERGAIVTAIAAGPLEDAGLGAQHVVLAIDGRDVADAAAFARIAADEHAHLEGKGGMLRLKVQTADPTPQELALEISPRPAGPGPGRPAGPGGPANPIAPAGPGVPAGGVNVWDRFGGGKSSGRDDPTQ